MRIERLGCPRGALLPPLVTAVHFEKGLVGTLRETAACCICWDVARCLSAQLKQLPQQKRTGAKANILPTREKITQIHLTKQEEEEERKKNGLPCHKTQEANEHERLPAVQSLYLLRGYVHPSAVKPCLSFSDHSRVQRSVAPLFPTANAYAARNPQV